MYYFDWDENKNRINLEKHGITFKKPVPCFSMTGQFYLMTLSIL